VDIVSVSCQTLGTSIEDAVSIHLSITVYSINAVEYSHMS